MPVIAATLLFLSFPLSFPFPPLLLPTRTDIAAQTMRERDAIQADQGRVANGSEGIGEHAGWS